MLPTRAWELGIGAALAIAGAARGRPIDVTGGAGTALSILSLGTLALAITLYTPAIAFPGWFVVLPILATTALIATPRSWANRHLLGHPAMQFVGKISYSWYLWHWPIFYLNRILEGPQGGLHGVTLIAVTFAFAILSWRFVETPLRHRVLPQRTVLWRYAFASLAVAAPAWLLYQSGGWIRRLPEPARAMAMDARAAQEGQCLARYGSADIRNPAACLPLPGDAPVIAILGDSHADALAPGIIEEAKADGRKAAVLTKSSCAPLLGFAFRIDGRPEHQQQCIAYQQRAFATVARRADIRTVVLAGYWRQLQDVPLFARDNVQQSSLEPALVESIDYLTARGKKVILVQDVPSFASDPYALTIGSHLPLRIALARAMQGKDGASGSAPPERDATRPLIARIAQGRSGVSLWDPHAQLCEEMNCTFAADGALFYSDGQHLTFNGARRATRGLVLN